MELLSSVEDACLPAQGWSGWGDQDEQWHRIFVHTGQDWGGTGCSGLQLAAPRAEQPFDLSPVIRTGFCCRMSG